MGLLMKNQVIKVRNLSLHWGHNERDGVSNHYSHDCLLNCTFRRRSKKTPNLRVTGHCEGTSPMTGEFPAQRASKAEPVSIWWRHRIMNTADNYKHSWQLVKHKFISRLDTVDLSRWVGLPYTSNHNLHKHTRTDAISAVINIERTMLIKAPSMLSPSGA